MKAYLHARGLPSSARRTACGLSTYTVRFVCRADELLALKTPPAPICPGCAASVRKGVPA